MRGTRCYSGVAEQNAGADLSNTAGSSTGGKPVILLALAGALLASGGSFELYPGAEANVHPAKLDASIPGKSELGKGKKPEPGKPTSEKFPPRNLVRHLVTFWECGPFLQGNRRRTETATRKRGRHGARHVYVRYRPNGSHPPRSVDGRRGSRLDLHRNHQIPGERATSGRAPGNRVRHN